MIHIIYINIILTRLLVTSSRRTINRVIWLILRFINTSLLLILLKLEFIAIFIIIVYVGAIAILFIFIIMILNLRNQKHKKSRNHLIPIRLIIRITLILHITEIIKKRKINNNQERISNKQIINLRNLEIIRNLIYSNYCEWLIIRRAILLLRMLTAILISEKENTQNIKQQLFTQIQRTIITMKHNLK
uniref:NADH-ubiquinone oxidoreductase chain 6 n=1 Tax=Aphrocallistes vastus TaxID=83887 RepID=B2BRQ0_APHVA|nr:NADH dehydrogenase subunit 6 [Aphrocallistes vastus]ABR58844.1 NADH dehydrogenase subunit 6 [Aphrocallistes vastus]